MIFNVRSPAFTALLSQVVGRINETRGVVAARALDPQGPRTVDQEGDDYAPPPTDSPRHSDRTPQYLGDLLTMLATLVSSGMEGQPLALETARREEMIVQLGKAMTGMMEERLRLSNSPPVNFLNTFANANRVDLAKLDAEARELVGSILRSWLLNASNDLHHMLLGHYNRFVESPENLSAEDVNQVTRFAGSLLQQLVEGERQEIGEVPPSLQFPGPDFQMVGTPADLSAWKYAPLENRKELSELTTRQATPRLAELLPLETARQLLESFFETFVEVNGHLPVSQTAHVAGDGFGLTRRPLNPNVVSDLNDLAWRCVDPSSDHSEPFQGLRTALRAAVLNNFADGSILDTLAHAFQQMGMRDLACIAAHAALLADHSKGADSAEAFGVLKRMMDTYQLDLSSNAGLVAFCGQRFDPSQPPVIDRDGERRMVDLNHPLDLNNWTYEVFTRVRENAVDRPFVEGEIALLQLAAAGAGRAVHLDRFNSATVLDTLATILIHLGDLKLADQAIALGSQIDVSSMAESMGFRAEASAAATRSRQVRRSPPERRQIGGAP